MLKKATTGILACALILCLLVGCGNTNTTPDDTSPSSTISTSPADSTPTVSESSYTPVTITVDLERSGLGDKVEQTFTEPPTRAVAILDQIGDILLDLGLADSIVGLARGQAGSVHDFPGRDNIETIWYGGWRDISREQLLSVSPDFLIGWDSTFSEDYFNKDFCQENGIAMYTPYVCTDFATFEDIYRDYETLGKIFDVEEVAAERIATMQATVARVQETLSEEVYENPITIFNYDSGEDEPFTACQGMPGDIFKLAGGISIFDDIEKAWATVSWEQIVERNPEVIIINEYTPGGSVESMEFLYNNPALAGVDAVVNQRIYAVSLDDLEGGCGSADVVAQIAAYLYPDLF